MSWKVWVVVEGLAGTGKTRVLESVIAEAIRLDIAVAAARAADVDRMTPLATLLRCRVRYRGYVPASRKRPSPMPYGG